MTSLNSDDDHPAKRPGRKPTHRTPLLHWRTMDAVDAMIEVPTDSER